MLARCCRGSIPACAGEPSSNGRMCAGCRVYPRVCGGTGVPIRLDLSDPGLSPRVRGNRAMADQLRGENGSIPACAGEPATLGQPTSAPGVYPRVCGGTKLLRMFPPSSTGLSPRVRGNRPGDHTWDLVDEGLSPRVRGNHSIPGLPRCSTAGRVYPRVCGGTLISWVM